jgi:hypothetical protein
MRDLSTRISGLFPAGAGEAARELKRRNPDRDLGVETASLFDFRPETVRPTAETIAVLLMPFCCNGITRQA